MNLMKWDPWKELEEVSNRLNNVFKRLPELPASTQSLSKMADWTPSVDISETDAAYLIKAEIPDVKKEDVQVSIKENGIYLSFFGWPCFRTHSLATARG